MKKIINKFNLGILLDFMLLITLIIQDTDWLRLFGTQLYKYVIIVMLLILIFDFIKNKKTIKINKIYLIFLVLIYAYLYIFSFNKIIIVPSAFYLIEITTFFLYVQSKDDKEALIKSVSNIILFASLIIAIFGIIQFISFKLNVDFIYKLLTQKQVYLFENRFSSIYTEPAHLCTIIGAGLFVSMYNLFINKNKSNYIFLPILLFVGIISGSVIVYISLAIFIMLFCYVVFTKGSNSDKVRNTRNIILITLTVVVLTFSIFEREVITSVVNKLQALLSQNNYSVVETKNDNSNVKIGIEGSNKKIESNDNSSIDVKNVEKMSSLQREIMYTQLSNGSAYAMKSNLYIGIEKLKDNYVFGTGMFTHIVYYDKYMTRIYPDGYVRINYTDACSMLLRIFSEFGIVGLLIFLGLLIYIIIQGLKNKDYFLLFILAVFITQSMRLGEYNWILNCLSFVIMLSSIKMKEKYNFYIKINNK